MIQSPELSIIVINYNTTELTLACLQSIVEHTKGTSYEILIIDNGSKPASLTSLQKFVRGDSRMRLIKSAKNLGFGRANNLAAKKARGEYLLLINSDTLVRDNAIGKSLKKAKSIPRLGVYSIKLLNNDLSNQVSGGAFPKLSNLIAWQFFIDDLPFVREHYKSFHPHQNRAKDIEWVTGAYMLIPKQAYLELGGFDPHIFMYTEEMELCYRLDAQGYKIVFNPNYSLIHLGGGSSGSHLALTSEIKYMIYFFAKHRSHLILPLVKLIFMVGSLLRFIIFGIIKNNAKSRKTYLDAIRLCL